MAVAMLKVYTARISYGGSDRLDITRKSAGPDGLAIMWGRLRPVRRAHGMAADFIEFDERARGAKGWT